MIRTVLGNVAESKLGVTLPHEHICCYSEYAYTMLGGGYLDKEKLKNVSVRYLRELKEKYGLNTFIDCTPVNIGRDIELLKEVSKKSGVNIICSTGFYYTEEPVLYNSSAELIAEYIIKDAENINAGIIKCAVDGEKLSDFNIKLLKASAKAHLKLNLPIALHTNVKDKNGLKALEILLFEGVKPQAITAGHLSDTENFGYLLKIAETGCYIGLDRLYDNTAEKYINRKVKSIEFLCEKGFTDKILLSHDASFFNGFEAVAKINKKPRFAVCFQNILPYFPKELIERFMIKNPIKMLKCGD